MVPPPLSPFLAVSFFSLVFYPVLDEFHAKHGRRHRDKGGGKPRKKSVCMSDTPDSAATVRQRNNNDVDGIDNKRDRGIPLPAGENCEQNDDKAGTPLPAIGPSPRAVPERKTDRPAGAAHRRSLFTGEGNPSSITDSGSSVGGDWESSCTSPTQVAPVHTCVCCGAEGGPGHGRRCAHTFRSCGFCRVEEVKRVLGIQDTGRRRRRGTSATLVSEECCALEMCILSQKETCFPSEY